MNKDCLYRAKQLQTGELIEGYPLIWKNMAFICSEPYVCMNGHKRKKEYLGFGEYVEVNPFTMYRTNISDDLKSIIEQLEEKALKHAINGQQYKENGYDIHGAEEHGISQGIEIALEIIKSGINATNGLKEAQNDR